MDAPLASTGADLDQSWNCDACNGLNPPGMRFCGHCGSPRGTTRPGVDEHRLVTALFADLSGFTALSERLDPERLVEVMNPILAMLTDTVVRYGGTIGKYAGDAILAFFGAPTSHEDDAVRALVAALEMHRQMASFAGEPVETPLALHIGINTGRVISGRFGGDLPLDYSLLGDATNVAQRLESTAPAGETFVGEATYALTRDQFTFEELGELTVKGRRGAVSAYRLIGERHERFDRATSPAASRSPSLVGRDLELGVLAEALGGLQAGRGAVILVAGDAGVGKTRLCDEARLRTGDGIRWLEARCLSYGAGMPYFPYADLFRRMFEVDPWLPPDVAAGAVAGMLSTAGFVDVAPFIVRLLGLSVATTGLEPEAFRSELHRAVTMVLRSAAIAQPTVLAIQDLHWADESTLQLTAALARACHDVPLAVLVTARPEVRDVAEELLAAGGDPVVIDLRPLDSPAVAEIATAVLGGGVADDLVAYVAELTGGNPLFVEESLRALIETERLRDLNGTWTLRRDASELAVAATVESLVAARVDRLPPRCREALNVTAVVGRRALVPLVRAVGTDVNDLDAALGELVDHGFLVRAEDGEGDVVIFNHALTQQVVYNRMLRRKRCRIHLRVAEAGERLYGHRPDFIDLLAHHLYLADAGGRAVDYLLLAAERSKHLFANDEAIVHLCRAIEIVTKDDQLAPTLPSILAGVAQLEERVGHYDEALDHYERLRDLTGDAEAWRGMASVMRQRGRFGDALGVIDAGLRAVGGCGADARPLLLEKGWALGASGRVAEAFDVLRDAVAVTAAARDRTQALLLLQLARAEIATDRFGDALAHAVSAEAIFEDLDDLPGLATTLRIVGDAHRGAGRLDDAAFTLRRALELAERVGNAEEIGGSLINLGMVEHQSGNIDAAIVCDRRALDAFERIGHGTGRAIVYGNLADKLASAGRHEEALDACQRAWDVATAIGHSATLGDVEETRAAIHLARGDEEAAIACYVAAADIFTEMGVRTRASRLLAHAARVASNRGDLERARALDDRARGLTAP